MAPRVARFTGSLWFGFFFFFNDTATTEIYTLSLHDALPISADEVVPLAPWRRGLGNKSSPQDRKSTRLNSSHGSISYAVFCLKKKNERYTKAVRPGDRSAKGRIGYWRGH